MYLYLGIICPPLPIHQRTRHNNNFTGSGSVCITKNVCGRNTTMKGHVYHYNHQKLTTAPKAETKFKRLVHWVGHNLLELDLQHQYIEFVYRGAQRCPSILIIPCWVHEAAQRSIFSTKLKHALITFWCLLTKGEDSCHHQLIPPSPCTVWLITTPSRKAPASICSLKSRGLQKNKGWTALDGGMGY